MKTLIALFSGACIGFVACYSFAQKFPSFGIGMSVAEASQIQTEKPLVASEVVVYTNEDEGLKLQTNKMIEYKDYAVTDGKTGDLFRLKNQCKIRITIGGEDSLTYRTFYFSNQELNHAIAATYQYPNDEKMSARATDNAFVQSLLSEETFNPKNPQIIDEFKALTTQFTPEQVASC